MKRVSIILALATVLALMLSVTALAELDQVTTPVPGDGTPDYLSPTVPYIPSDNIVNGGTNSIHSGYAKNTDACASCHSTHTAVGVGLLQWADVNETCYACHDGTVAKTYDVVSGKIGETTAITFGGLFGGTGTSMSVHGVTAGVTTGAAPGGSGADIDDTHGTWSEEFTCAACHSPHGTGGNARILSPDPNGIALLNKVVGETLTTTDNLVYSAAKGYWLNSYPYSKSTKVTSSVVGETFTIDYKAGTVTFATADASRVVTANYVPALRVTMDIPADTKMTAAETVTYTSGVNAFCGACHTDYNTESVTSPHANLSGTYTDAYRHKVGFKRYAEIPGLKLEHRTDGLYVNCLTCHVAHGTDQAYWQASLAGADDGFWTEATTVEFDGNSALKRKPNMGTCESCHAKGPASFN